MKTIINSQKRTYWFKVSVALITCLLCLSFPCCQKDEINQDSILDMDGLSSSALLQSSSTSFASLYYGHEMFVVPMGGEGSFEATRTINKDIVYFEKLANTFVLKVQNGGDNYAKVPTVEIKINNKLIIKSSDFKKVHLVEKKLQHFTNPAQLDVKIVGDPTILASIELWIEGTVSQGRIKDIDGNAYKTVKIGDQWWMAENLKVTKFNNGSDIPLVTDNLGWNDYNGNAPCFCWYYNNKTIYKNTYGALYNWYAVTDSRNVCPSGWRVPTEVDWSILISSLGGESGAGGKLKEIGQTHWVGSGTNWENGDGSGATNESGFTAIGAGFRNWAGEFSWTIDYFGYWWSITEDNAYMNYARALGLFWFTNEGKVTPYPNRNGFSVRCIKDSN